MYVYTKSKFDIYTSISYNHQELENTGELIYQLVCIHSLHIIYMININKFVYEINAYQNLISINLKYELMS